MHTYFKRARRRSVTSRSGLDSVLKSGVDWACHDKGAKKDAGRIET